MQLFGKCLSVAVILALTCVPFVFCQFGEALIDTSNGVNPLGKIQGAYAWTSKKLGAVGRKYYWFTGIPYAKPDSYTGDNRFKPSKVWDGLLPVDTNGTFYAGYSKVRNHCPQNAVIDLGLGKSNATKSFDLIRWYYSQKGVEERLSPHAQIWGVEDCLVATVSTPRLPNGNEGETKLLPVLFFIHGGGFDAFWGSVFGGQRLLNHDVVLVTMNYRLGVLGAFNLGIEEAPGNAAVYDCIEALKWVQKYIHHFGGDKDRVTISGQSAGAVLATTLFLSPLSKDLFHGVLGASGSALSVWAVQNNPIRENLKLVRFIEACKDLVPSLDQPLNDTNAKEILTCVKRQSTEILVKARNDYGRQENLNARLGYDAIVPSVQSPSLAGKVDLALPQSPKDILKALNQSNVPLMMGANRHDGSFVFDSTYYNFLVANGLDSDVNFIRNELLPQFMKGVGLEDPSGALLHAFQKAYLGDAANSDDILSKFPGLLDIHSAVGFKAGAYNLVEAHSKLNPKSYYYAFDYQGLFTTYGFSGGFTSQVPGGVAHIDDLLYMFQLIPLITDKDWMVSDRFVNYWANFVIYGNPNGPGDLDKPFPRFDASDHRFLVINSSSSDTVEVNCRNTWYRNSIELIR